MNDMLIKYARAGFLKDIIYNNIYNAKQILHFKKLLGIEVNFNTVFVLTIDNYYSLTFNKSELQKQKLRIQVLEILEKIASEMDFYVINTSEDIFALLLRTEFTEKSNADELINSGNTIIKKIYRATNIAVSIGIGRPCRDIQNLHLSYKEATLACSNKFFSSGNQVIHVSQVPSFSEDLCIFSEEIESELTIKILSCCEEEAYHLIANILTKSSSICDLNPLLLKTRLIELATMLVKTAFETGANENRLSEISINTVSMLLQADIIHDLEITMKKAVNDIIKEIRLTRKRKNLVAFQKSLEFIRSNYHHHISLEEVANSVNLNPFYFSHGFKSFTGISLIDYMTKIRIEQAKKLLLASNESITIIAEHVGYDNANYFSRVFRNEVGMPPSKYRTLLGGPE